MKLANIAIALLALLVLATPFYARGQTTNGIWANAKELSTLPMTGPAWIALKARADADPGLPLLNDQKQMNNVYVLAKALVFARTGDQRYRLEVIDQCMKAINTELGGRTLALGRELAAYVIAADLVKLPPDKNLIFRAWLTRTLAEPLDGESLRATHERRPNNWGTHAGASRAAVAAYLGDMVELNRTALVFRGWLGDRTVYSGFKFGDLDWQCDATKPVGINPAGCIKAGHLVDGVLPDDQRRAGIFVWPPPKENYVWEALQGAVVQAEILKRSGYDTYNWSNKALLRAVSWLYLQDGFPAASDDTWEPYLINYRYRTHFAAPLPSKPGKNMAWTDWTHGPGRTLPPPPVAAPPVARAASTGDLTTDAGDATSAGANGSTRLQQDATSVHYNGVWYADKYSQYSGGTVAYSPSAGARATLSFTGTSVSVLGYRDNASGIANVYVDGSLVAEVDMFSATSAAPAPIYASATLGTGAHQIAIEVSGRKNAGSVGALVRIDAFDFIGAAASAAKDKPSLARNVSALSATAVDSAQGSYAQIARTDGVPSPLGGLAVLRRTQDSPVATPTATTASRLVDGGRIYIEASAQVSTAIAVVNPNDETNTVDFVLTDAQGHTSRSGRFTLAAHAQLSRLVAEAPFDGRTVVSGTLTFMSALPVAMTATRRLVNERGETLLSPLPIAALAPARADVAVIPHLATGAGWTSRIVLVNPTDAAISGTLRSSGTGAPVEYAIAPKSTWTAQLANTAAPQTSAVQIRPAGADKTPTAMAIVSYAINGVTVSEAAIPSIQTGAAFRLFVESSGTSGEADSIDATIAIANAGNQAAQVKLELSDAAGVAISATSIAVPANGYAGFLLSRIPGFAQHFKGTLRATANSADIALIGLRGSSTERGEVVMTTSEAIDEALIHPNAMLVFPELLRGPGYSTQLIVLEALPETAPHVDLLTETGQLTP
ncbi:MAG: hypothetical protein ABI612_02990 [Betaproteobacteria bacterium]